MANEICPYCGLENPPQLYKKRLGTFCDNCINTHYSKCRKCNKLVQKGLIVSFSKIMLADQAKYGSIFLKFSHLCKQCFSVEKEPYDLKAVQSCECCGSTSQVIYNSQIGMHLCGRCRERLYKCFTCGKWHINLNSSYCDPEKVQPLYYQTFEGEEVKICRDCYRSLGERTNIGNYVLCSYCSVLKRISQDGLRDFQRTGRYLCSSCINNGIHYCKYCESTYQEYKGQPSSKDCCEHCAIARDLIKLDLVKCEKCGDQMFNEIFKKDNKEYCRKCIGKVTLRQGPPDLENNIPFGEYNYVPKYFYKHGDKTHDTLLIGTENEIYCKNQEERNDRLIELYDTFNESEVFIKFDGSIDGRNGFEIITHPMTYDYILETLQFNKFIFNEKRNSTCGMHVHLSKCFFSKTTLYKFIHFLTTHPKLVFYVAEREPTRYCNPLPNKHYIFEFAKRGSNWNLDKHVQVNLKHRKTVEVRVFAQAITPDQWIKNVQFCVVLANFCKDKSFKRIDLKNFWRYLEGNKSRYPQLHSYLFSKGLDYFIETENDFLDSEDCKEDEIRELHVRPWHLGGEPLPDPPRSGRITRTSVVPQGSSRFEVTPEMRETRGRIQRDTIRSTNIESVPINWDEILVPTFNTEEEELD